MASITVSISDHRVNKRRRCISCHLDRNPSQNRFSSSLVLALLGMFAMSSVAARRAAQFHLMAKGRPAFSVSRIPPTSAFAICSGKQRRFESASFASSSAVSSLSPSILSMPPSALCMANPNRSASASNRQARSRSRSLSAVSSPATKTNNSNADTSNDSDQNKKKKQQPKKKKKKEANTGRLRLLPSLQPSTEILSRAQRQTHNEIKDDLKIANARRRTQKRGAQTIDLLCQKLCSPLKVTVQTYRWELKRMHPFEKVVMELTVRARQKKDGLTLTTLLEEVHEGRKELLQLSKDWISKIKTAPTAREAYECTEEAKGIIGKVFLDLIEEPWGGVMELQKSLRNVPIVRLDCPAVVLVGAPNVGKSSIVRAISSGTPEVNNYPFTTRGMTLGHVQVFWESDRDVAVGNVAGVSIPSERQLVQERLLRRGMKTRRMVEKEVLKEYSREKEDAKKGEEEEGGVEMDDTADSAIESGGDEEREHNSHNNDATPAKINKPDLSKKIFPISQLCQIMDSPGILRRGEAEVRNEMEELTLAAMAHLPTAVMYVMDLSGGAGDKCSSVEDQLVLRRELRARFPRRPWIDVISKVDLGIVDGAGERLMQILDAEREQRGGGDAAAADQSYIELSIKEGQGVDELRQEVMRMLGEVRVVLDAMAAMDDRSARAV